MLPVARADLRTDDIVAIVVTSGDGMRAAGVCQLSTQATIVVPITTVELAQRWGVVEAVVARALAHELAHVALHFQTSKDRATKEAEADALGIYYFRRAGWSCRTWIDLEGTFFKDDGGRMAAIARENCAAAERGQRPR